MKQSTTSNNNLSLTFLANFATVKEAFCSTEDTQLERELSTRCVEILERSNWEPFGVLAKVAFRRDGENRWVDIFNEEGTKSSMKINSKNTIAGREAADKAWELKEVLQDALLEHKGELYLELSAHTVGKSWGTMYFDRVQATIV